MRHNKIDFYHHELNDWKKSLEFYKDEIKVLETRLGEVVKQNTGQSVLSESEHFQNQFILQKEQIDLLKHHINEQDKKFEEKATPYDMSMNQPLLSEQEKLRGQFSSTEKIFTDTRQEFYRFVSKVL